MSHPQSIQTHAAPQASVNFLSSPASIVAEHTFAGCGTFLRVPRATSAAGADVAILGVPFDLATSNRPGARFAPAAIRSASSQLAELKAYPGGFDPLAFAKTVDLGDVFFDHGRPATIPTAIEAAASAVLDHDAFLIGLGGDHFVSYPLIAAHAKKHGPLALIHFDAHTDTWTSTAGPGEDLELNHGTMFWRAAKEGAILPERSVQVGIRTWVDDPMGFTIVDGEVAAERRADEIASLIARVTGGAPCYVTIDIDCLDPAYAPGTGTPVTGGLTPLKLLQTLRGIAHLNIVGCDIVEVLPAYDQGGITALNAATVVYEQICRIAGKRGAVPKRYANPFN